MNIIKLLQQYKKEKEKWKKAGSPVRSKEQIAAIYEICSQCPNFNPKGGMIPGYDQCDLCKCNLHPTFVELNKLAWGTTSCPDRPTRWESEMPSGEA